MKPSIKFNASSSVMLGDARRTLLNAREIEQAKDIDSIGVELHWDREDFSTTREMLRIFEQYVIIEDIPQEFYIA